MSGEIIRLHVDPSNRREQFRRTVLKGARIIFNDRQSALNCRVRDMTTGGARLDLSTQQLLPHEFDLQVSGSPALQRCGLRWAYGNFVGVRFLPDAV
jgi:hypothetical protein